MSGYYPTLEVRWFRQGAVPGGVLEWFLQCDPEPERGLARTDHYLPIPHSAAVGIKLRDGNLEIKRLHRELGLVHVHAGVSGVLEEWHKWRFPVGEDDATDPGGERPASPWIAVAKERLSRRYEVTDSGQVARMAPLQVGGTGGNLELTDVGALGQHWWTVSIEAFGPEASLGQAFSLVCERVFARGGPPGLDSANSYGYPRFLEEIA